MARRRADWQQKSLSAGARARMPKMSAMDVNSGYFFIYMK
jgi:hypothetical protein